MSTLLTFPGFYKMLRLLRSAATFCCPVSFSAFLLLHGHCCWSDKYRISGVITVRGSKNENFSPWYALWLFHFLRCQQPVVWVRMLREDVPCRTSVSWCVHAHVCVCVYMKSVRPTQRPTSGLVIIHHPCYWRLFCINQYRQNLWWSCNSFSSFSVFAAFILKGEVRKESVVSQTNSSHPEESEDDAGERCLMQSDVG